MPLYQQGFEWTTFLNFSGIILIGMAYSHVYRNYLKNKNWRSLKPVNLSFIFILAPYTLAIVWTISTVPLTIIISQTHKLPSLGDLFFLSVQFYFVYFGWTMIYSFYQIFMNFRQSEVEKWKLEAKVKEAQLLALKSQINPHFIFNSLNNIRSLILEDQDRARDMITNLSGLLRYSIQFNHQEKVSLRQEMTIVKSYLQLESIQFENRLDYRIETDEMIMDNPIPPMSVQILVENAIKHGISKLPRGGKIKIKIKEIENAIKIEVINTGKLATDHSPESTGIGLKNANERISLLFGESADFSLQSISDSEVCAKFIIPQTHQIKI